MGVGVNLSRKYLAALVAHDYLPIDANLDQRLKDYHVRGELEKLSTLFLAGKPTDMKLIGLYRNNYSIKQGLTHEQATCSRLNRTLVTSPRKSTIN